MANHQDFGALQDLFALARQDRARDTQMDEFLTELHRRQRAQLLTPKSRLRRGASWLREHITRLEWAPALSYGGVAAAIALTAFLGLTQQATVASGDTPSRFTFHMPIHEVSFAMLPGSTLSAGPFAPKSNENPDFASVRSETAATRYVLANNAPGANDATVAF